jgi:hypothetical protein
MPQGRVRIMGKSLAALSVAMLALSCVQAHFSPEKGKDSGVGPDEGSLCPAPALACTPTPGVAPCDPACQTGGCDWCTSKCSVAGDDGAFICTASGTKLRNETCHVHGLGTHAQADDCAPGLICLGDFASDNTQCFALCGSNVDCPGVACADRPVIPPAPGAPLLTAKVCDPPYRSCATNCGDPRQGTGCLTGQVSYLITNDPLTGDNRTVCESTQGAGARGAACSHSRECAPGWFCLDTGVCHQVCDVMVANSCLNGGGCQYYGKQYGYCP